MPGSVRMEEMALLPSTKHSAQQLRAFGVRACRVDRVGN